jgi:DNA uptake protein ComE-like DNA-binding protein
VCQIPRLPSVRFQAQNGSVRIVRLTTSLAMILLFGSLAGIAQYPDWDNDRAPKASATAPPPEARIDINRASVSELMKIPGMTQSWAGRIVRFRPYYTKQDLLDRGVVTSQVYDRIKDYVIAHRDKP